MIGSRYQFEIPGRYFAATAENRCSEDLPYSHAVIRVPTIVLREPEFAPCHENQSESYRRDVQAASVVKTFSVNSLINNERRSEKPSNPRRRARIGPTQAVGLAVGPAQPVAADTPVAQPKGCGDVAADDRAAGVLICRGRQLAVSLARR
jgi:hypothetical protein